MLRVNTVNKVIFKCPHQSGIAGGFEVGLQVDDLLTVDHRPLLDFNSVDLEREDETPQPPRKSHCEDKTGKRTNLVFLTAKVFM